MPARLRRNLTFANVCSFIALVIALGTGGAYAANTVGSSDIIDGEVKTDDLGAAAVTSVKIAEGAVNSAKVVDGGIGVADIAAGAVDGSKVADGAVTGSKLADGAVTSAKVLDGGIGNVDVGADAIDGSKVADGSLTVADLRGASVAGALLDVKKGGVKTGRCKDFVVAAAGASPGEAVLLSAQGTLPSSTVLSAVGVSSAGAVTVKVCNLKPSGKLPAIAGLPLMIITLG